MSSVFSALKYAFSKPGLQMIGTGMAWGAYVNGVDKHEDFSDTNVVTEKVVRGALCGGLVGFVLALDRSSMPRYPVAGAVITTSVLTAISYQRHLYQTQKKQSATKNL